jgi:hypothetical protein
MRVLYLIKSFDFGGAENHVLDLANSMTEIGNDVYLITRKGSLLISRHFAGDLRQSLFQ